MYLSNVAQLVLGSRAIMYDGSPLKPDPGVLVRVAAAHKATKLGISPRWLAEVAAAGIRPREHADLSALEIVTTTGMVLPDQLFEYASLEPMTPHQDRLCLTADVPLKTVLTPK